MAELFILFSKKMQEVELKVSGKHEFLFKCEEITPETKMQIVDGVSLYPASSSENRV